MPDKYPHTAIATWSGYVFQGYCAIHHTLCLINKAGSVDTLANYNLQLDSIEDFTILEQDTAKSLHQCKAYKDDRYAAYTEALKKLKDKVPNYPGASFFLHTTKEIADKKIADLHKENNPIKLYQYGTNYFCPTDKLEEFIIAEIKKYQKSKHSKEGHRGEDRFCRNIKDKLSSLINAKILYIHRQIQEAKNKGQYEIAFQERIALKEFITILDENYVSASKEYIIWLHRASIMNYLVEYGEDCKHKNIAWKDVLEKYFNAILAMNDEEFISFAKQLTPHRVISFEDFESYSHNKPSIDEYKDALFEILYKLIECPNALYWQTDDGDFHPSTIARFQDKKRDVCRGIDKNPEISALFRNKANIITLHIDAESVRKCANPLADVSESMDQIGEENKKHNNLTDIGDISLVSLNNPRLNPILDK